MTSIIYHFACTKNLRKKNPEKRIVFFIFLLGYKSIHDEMNSILYGATSAAQSSLLAPASCLALVSRRRKLGVIIPPGPAAPGTKNDSAVLLPPKHRTLLPQ